ncbi:hypothetical protein ROZALSC1DRAFT_29542 [Rozella allomycis CSF55]|uniref:Uncharacterized protein n=1 Tax=Rozella allomycis (strain CSF55) TaxID=988480 RepID=A0A4P9YHP3_ROZAC|nr:hypothetical protein ROZALSC1DRAFT_29542 [Rozella allomycis CSF55]
MDFFSTFDSKKTTLCLSVFENMFAILDTFSFSEHQSVIQKWTREWLTAGEGKMNCLFTLYEELKLATQKEHYPYLFRDLMLMISVGLIMYPESVYERVFDMIINTEENPMTQTSSQILLSNLVRCDTVPSDMIYKLLQVSPGKLRKKIGQLCTRFRRVAVLDRVFEDDCFDKKFRASILHGTSSDCIKRNLKEYENEREVNWKNLWMFNWKTVLDYKEKKMEECRNLQSRNEVWERWRLGRRISKECKARLLELTVKFPQVYARVGSEVNLCLMDQEDDRIMLATYPETFGMCVLKISKEELIKVFSQMLEKYNAARSGIFIQDTLQYERRLRNINIYLIWIIENLINEDDENKINIFKKCLDLLLEKNDLEKEDFSDCDDYLLSLSSDDEELKVEIRELMKSLAKIGECFINNFPNLGNFNKKQIVKKIELGDFFNIYLEVYRRVIDACVNRIDKVGLNDAKQTAIFEYMIESTNNLIAFYKQLMTKVENTFFDMKMEISESILCKLVEIFKINKNIHKKYPSQIASKFGKFNVDTFNKFHALVENFILQEWIYPNLDLYFNSLKKKARNKELLSNESVCKKLFEKEFVDLLFEFEFLDCENFLLKCYQHFKEISENLKSPDAYKFKIFSEGFCTFFRKAYLTALEKNIDGTLMLQNIPFYDIFLRFYCIDKNVVGKEDIKKFDTCEIIEFISDILRNFNLNAKGENLNVYSIYSYFDPELCDYFISEISKMIIDKDERVNKAFSRFLQDEKTFKFTQCLVIEILKNLEKRNVFLTYYTGELQEEDDEIFYMHLFPYIAHRDENSCRYFKHKLKVLKFEEKIEMLMNLNNMSRFHIVDKRTNENVKDYFVEYYNLMRPSLKRVVWSVISSAHPMINAEYFVERYIYALHSFDLELVFSVIRNCFNDLYSHDLKYFKSQFSNFIQNILHNALKLYYLFLKEKDQKWHTSQILINVEKWIQFVLSINFDFTRKLNSSSQIDFNLKLNIFRDPKALHLKNKVDPRILEMIQSFLIKSFISVLPQNFQFGMKKDVEFDVNLNPAYFVNKFEEIISFTRERLNDNVVTIFESISQIPDLGKSLIKKILKLFKNIFYNKKMQKDPNFIRVLNSYLNLFNNQEKMSEFSTYLIILRRFQKKNFDLILKAIKLYPELIFNGHIKNILFNKDQNSFFNLFSKSLKFSKSLSEINGTSKLSFHHQKVLLEYFKDNLSNSDLDIKSRTFCLKAITNLSITSINDLKNIWLQCKENGSLEDPLFIRVFINNGFVSRCNEIDAIFDFIFTNNLLHDKNVNINFISSLPKIVNRIGQNIFFSKLNDFIFNKNITLEMSSIKAFKHILPYQSASDLLYHFWNIRNNYPIDLSVTLITVFLERLNNFSNTRDWDLITDLANHANDISKTQDCALLLKMAKVKPFKCENYSFKDHFTFSNDQVANKYFHAVLLKIASIPLTKVDSNDCNTASLIMNQEEIIGQANKSMLSWLEKDVKSELNSLIYSTISIYLRNVIVAPVYYLKTNSGDHVSNCIRLVCELTEEYNHGDVLESLIKELANCLLSSGPLGYIDKYSLSFKIQKYFDYRCSGFIKKFALDGKGIKLAIDSNEMSLKAIKSLQAASK